MLNSYLYTNPTMIGGSIVCYHWSIVCYPNLYISILPQSLVYPVSLPFHIDILTRTDYGSDPHLILSYTNIYYPHPANPLPVTMPIPCLYSLFPLFLPHQAWTFNLNGFDIGTIWILF